MIVTARGFLILRTDTCVEIGGGDPDQDVVLRAGANFSCPQIGAGRGLRYNKRPAATPACLRTSSLENPGHAHAARPHHASHHRRGVLRHV